MNVNILFSNVYSQLSLRKYTIVDVVKKCLMMLGNSPLSLNRHHSLVVLFDLICV